MNKITPKISSGDLLLIINETVCFDSAKGITFLIPIFDKVKKVAGNDLVFNFRFEYGANKNGEIKYEINGNKVDIIIQDFGENGIFSGTANPLSFKLGEKPLLLYFSGHTIKHGTDNSSRFICLTVCIYQGQVK